MGEREALRGALGGQHAGSAFALGVQQAESILALGGQHAFSTGASLSSFTIFLCEHLTYRNPSIHS